MNKPLLIVICDFLLISLLALARFDVTEAERKVQSVPDPETAANAGPEQDLIDALKRSLEEERLAREQMDALLKQAQERLDQSQTQLAQREEEVQTTQEKLAEEEEKARRLAAEQALLQQRLQASRAQLDMMQQEYDTSREKLASLQQQYNLTQEMLESLSERYESTQSRLDQVQNQYQTSQEDIDLLQKKLATAQSEARINQEVVKQLEQDLRQRVSEKSVMLEEIQKLDQERQQVMVERQQLSGKLQVVETEKRMTTEQLETARQEIETVREEKAVIQEQATKLAENVSTLAKQSDQLTAEIRQGRPLTPNTIFNDFASNRVQVALQASRAGLFGQTVRKQASPRAICFSLNGQVYTVLHQAETPFDFAAVGTEWSSVTLSLQGTGQPQALAKLAFMDRDPRIVVAPVSPTQAQAIGHRIYDVPQDLFQFEEAVLVGVTDDYYGECEFQIDPQTPGYMKMQRERFGRLFGKFVPSRGDLVFTKTGELIGIMANNEYCLVLNDVSASRSIQLGNQVPKELVAAYLSQMFFQLEDLPFRLR